MPLLVRGGVFGVRSESSDGEIFEASIPTGTVLERVNYTAYSAHGRSVHRDLQNNSDVEDSTGYRIVNGYKTSFQQWNNTTTTFHTKTMVKTNIIISDIREFFIKIGNYSFDISLDKFFYTMTRKIYAGFHYVKNNSFKDVYITNDKVNNACLLLTIEKGVIKEIGFGIYDISTSSGEVTDVDISIKVNTVARSIIDADALPADVAAGKTFYNNDGKQVGSGEFFKTFVYTSNKIKTGNISFTSSETVLRYDLSYTNVTQYVTGTFYNFAEIAIPNMKNIIGASINGKSVPVFKDHCEVLIGLVNEDFFCIGLASNKMYLKHADIEKVKSVTIKVYYN